MKIDILKNCFRRDGSKAPSILKRNTLHDLPDKEAKALIDLGYAAEYKEEKPKKAEAKEDRSEEKKDGKKEEMKAEPKKK
ncbi:hypothetical protein Pan258_01870 [Symmachiella dynata]|uniref:hypothetical protein n=1 Tax=Symmachiella dynata TaxID=2527995 RepID=UPI00118B58C3|nr:hypothetical protein [Symmachiella dynata]QDT46170.1 hypothetical protein Pan258_01870 [Symmachiella dynata]